MNLLDDPLHNSWKFPSSLTGHLTEFQKIQNASSPGFQSPLSSPGLCHTQTRISQHNDGKSFKIVKQLLFTR